MEQAPLILTLAIMPEAQAYFDQLRKQHFPKERNFLDAHLTLFHHLTLPEQELRETILKGCQRQASFPLQVTGLMPLGRGVAFKIESETLTNLHAQLQQRWFSSLTAQDQQKLRPHITVQNKVTPEAANALLQTLSSDFQPFVTVATGLTLWRYMNGPWELLERFDFQGR
ncbi:hypothetical protein TH61_12980 [Rufibacter sp. DG15C]|uniref:2'-5' RNA ligase family protein n=1 Tax=Rufibacter sp. DG15C TaxID=1379909 RepID=UPI00078CB4A1|nr:2'-5' RNA ligase family protein [Rufibacter sp. DG15C]AMM51910.1 hypothetical protein TH61_12980 [Rufibacter sp. DG15C]